MQIAPPVTSALPDSVFGFLVRVCGHSFPLLVLLEKVRFGWVHVDGTKERREMEMLPPRL